MIQITLTNFLYLRIEISKKHLTDMTITVILKDKKRESGSRFLYLV